MNEEKRYEQIQDYLNGTLDSSARNSFEQELAQDPELKAELDLHLLADDAIELLIEDDLRNELQDMAKEESLKKKNNKGGRVVSMRRRIYTLSIAATVALAIGFFAAMLVGNQYDNSSIAQELYIDDVLETRRGANSESLLQEGMNLYTNNEYEEAITYFDQVTDPSLIAEANYAAAHAHYNLENYSAAMQNFALVIDSKDPRYEEKAEFFYLTSALAADQVEEQGFLDVLDELINDEGHTYHKEALAINKKLKSFWRNF